MQEMWCMNLDLPNELTTARYNASLGLARNPFCYVVRLNPSVPSGISGTGEPGRSAMRLG